MSHAVLQEPELLKGSSSASEVRGHSEGLTWQCGGAGELGGQLKLRGVSLHGCSYQELEGPLEEAWRRSRWCCTLRFSSWNIVLWLCYLLLSIVLLLGGSRCGRGVGRRSPRTATRPAAGPALKKTNLRHSQTGTCCSGTWRQTVKP